MTALTGTRILLPVTMKQDIRNVAPWVVVISVLSASSILAYRFIFPEDAERMAFANTVGSNPGLWFVFGKPLDMMTNDGFNAWRAGSLGAFFTGLMAILIVVRNSRAAEDSGQAELIASGVVTRQARLMVAIVMAAIASVGTGVLSFVVTMACGGAWKPTLVLSACFTASGLMFGSLAAVTAQLGSYARTASSLAVGLLGIGYVIRGYLDSSDSPDWVIWATPLGWLERTRPSTDNNGWPLLAALAFTVLMVVLAWTLQRRRDFGLGMIPARPGPANGGLVASVGGLAVRVNRGSLLTWLAAFAALGFVFGNLSASVGDLLAANPSIAAVIASGAVTETDLTFAFACTMLQITGILAAVTGVQVMMRLYVEESELRAEPVLAGALRRPTYLASHVVLALVASGVALLVTGTGVGLVVSTSDTGVQFGDVLAQAGATVPAAWVLVAVSVAAIGAHPGKRLVAWAAVVATFALTLLGPTFDLPNWALGISPLHHVPTVTAANPDWRSLVVLCGLVVLLGVVGFAGYRRRDIG